MRVVKFIALGLGSSTKAGRSRGIRLVLIRVSAMLFSGIWRDILNNSCSGPVGESRIQMFTSKSVFIQILASARVEILSPRDSNSKQTKC